MAGTYEDDNKSKENADMELYKRVLKPYEYEADEALKHVKKIGDVIPGGVKEVLTRRWTQVKELVQQAMDIHEFRGT
jgi:hypothetical protein